MIYGVVGPPLESVIEYQQYDHCILHEILRIFDFASFRISFKIKGGGKWKLYYEKTPALLNRLCKLTSF